MKIITEPLIILVFVDIVSKKLFIEGRNSFDLICKKRLQVRATDKLKFQFA
jgi:hypothetical protein